MKAGRKRRDRYVNELSGIYDFVCHKFDLDIKDKNRTQLYSDARTLFCVLANETTDATFNEIGSYIDRHHATVLHAVRNLKDNLLRNRKYSVMAITYKNALVDERALVYGTITLSEALDKIDKLKEENKNHVPLTVNEMAYRKLNADDKALYDERANLVLKSFEWKRKEENRKEVFETINIGM